MSDTNDSSNTSTGSPGEMESTAHSLELPQKKSLLQSSSSTEKHLYPQLKVEGGPIASISKSISNAVSKNYSEKTKLATARFLNTNSRGLAGAAAIKCQGSSCVLVDVCPITGTDDPYPIGQRCPFMLSLVQLWVNKHLIAMGIDDYNLPEYSYDMDLLYELAGQELIRWQAAQQLAVKGTLVEERIVNTTMTGSEIVSEVLSPLLEVVDTQSKIIMKIRDALLATRKAQIQAGKDAGDPSKRSAEIASRARNKINERLRTLREEEEDVVDADFDIQ